MKFLLPLLALGLFALNTAGAADKPSSPTHKLSEFKLGPQLSGPPVSATTLKGKAVLLDCWGIHCGPCLAALPEMERLSHRYASKLVLVGVHCQENDPTAISSIVKKNRLSYPIVSNLTSPSDFRALPHVLIFDAQGALIFDGTPFDQDYERMLRKAISSVPEAPAPSALEAMKKPGA